MSNRLPHVPPSSPIPIDLSSPLASGGRSPTSLTPPPVSSISQLTTSLSAPNRPIAAPSLGPGIPHIGMIHHQRQQQQQQYNTSNTNMMGHIQSQSNNPTTIHPPAHHPLQQIPFRPPIQQPHQQATPPNQHHPSSPQPQPSSTQQLLSPPQHHPPHLTSQQQPHSTSSTPRNPNNSPMSDVVSVGSSPGNPSPSYTPVRHPLSSKSSTLMDSTQRHSQQQPPPSSAAPPSMMNHQINPLRPPSQPQLLSDHSTNLVNPTHHPSDTTKPPLHLSSASLYHHHHPSMMNIPLTGPASSPTPNPTRPSLTSPPPASTAAVLNLCQQFLSSHGFDSAAEALSELKPASSDAFSTQPSKSRPHVTHDNKDALPPVYLQFRHFVEWIDYGLENLLEELLEVAFVVFVEVWLNILKTSSRFSRLLLSEFWDHFAPFHLPQLEEMVIVVDAKQHDLIMPLRWWRAQRFHLFISRLGYQLLQDYITKQDPPNIVTTFLHTIQTRVTFHVISQPLVEIEDHHGEDTSSLLLEDHDQHESDDGDHNESTEMKHRDKRRKILKSSAQITVGAPPNRTSSPSLINWGLLAGPFSSVQSLDLIPTRPTPSYMKSDTTPKALINGEVTQPVDPNLSLPLTNESPWILNRWSEMHQKLGSAAILAKSLADFPSVLAHSFDELPAELSSLRMNRLSGRWICTGRESGALELWDVAELSVHDTERKSDGDETMEDDHEFGGPTNTDETDKQKKKKIPTPQLLLGHSGTVTSIAFLRPSIPAEDLNLNCETHLLSSSVDSTVRIWSIDKQQQLASIEAHQSTVWTLDTSPYGNFFLCGSADRLGSLWEFGRRQPLRLFSGHTSDVEIIKCWPNSILAATGSSDTTVKVWDVRSSHQVRDLRRHQSAVSKIAVSPNGRILASGGMAGPVIIWDIATTKPLRFVAIPKHYGVTCLDFAHGSRYLAIGCTNGSIIMVDIEVSPGDQKDSLHRHPSSRVLPLGQRLPCDINFNPENLLLVCTIPLPS